MTLEAKPSSGWWYGRFLVKGKLHRVNLGVRIEGQRPASMGQEGDGAFERSRGRALKEHDRVLGEISNRKNIEELTSRLIEIKTGGRMEFVPLDRLADAWMALPRKRQPSPDFTAYCRNTLGGFASFIQERFSLVKDLASVSRDHVREYMEAQERRGISARTWNGILSLLRGVFKKLEPGADAYRHYLLTTPARSSTTVHRQPFCPEAIQLILEAAKDDDLMRPMIVVALCTAMRRGDCALLPWSSVDMKAGFITVKTSKTGDTVEIPILPLLREELIRAGKTHDVFVFPQVAKMYRENPTGLNLRLSKILEKAGLEGGGGTGADNEIHPGHIAQAESPMSREDLERRGLEAIDKARMIAAKRIRMKEAFLAYISGKSLPQIALEMNVSKGTVSGHLNAVQNMMRIPLIRSRKANPTAHKYCGSIKTVSPRGQRLKRGSIMGWHSFRTTFITQALSAGMPMELVRRITGHTTTDIVLKHYFKPGREQFQHALNSAMPKMLLNGALSRDDQMRQIVTNLSARTLKQDKERLLALLNQGV